MSAAAGIDMDGRALTAGGRYVDREVVQRLLKIMDAAVLFAAALVASVLNLHDLGRSGQAEIVGFLSGELALLCIFLMRAGGLYEMRALTEPMATAARATAICFVTGTAVFELTQRLFLPMSHAWLPLWLALLAAHFGASRTVAALWAKPNAARGRFRKRLAIVGGGKAAEEALALLEESRGLDIEIVGLFDDRFDTRSPQAVRRHRKIGRIEDLASYARANRVDLIVVAIPLSAEGRLLAILKRLWELPVDIRISGRATRLQLGRRAYDHLGKLPLLPVFDRPLKGWSLIAKDAVDRLLAAAAIAVLAPVMVAVAAAVRIESKGPVIFRQKRYGFNNELIEVFKFRSMFVDRCDANAAKLVSRNDSRVTRVGRFIRKTSLDELPQLFNVLTGRLSLVGPRPHATQAKAADTLYEQVVDGYFARHRVKPGITGWAQINGWRGETDTAEKLAQRVRHDLDYIDRWSLGFDLYILARTPFALLATDSAY
jgi:Undecaprenyl-phosphate glucose phosphotransferase